MILSVRVNNFLVYSNEIELSLIADMRIKRFVGNVYKSNNFNALKSVCIYGANNSGKTCLIRAINSIRNVILATSAELPLNIFTNSKVYSNTIRTQSDSSSKEEVGGDYHGVGERYGNRARTGTERAKGS